MVGASAINLERQYLACQRKRCCAAKHDYAVRKLNARLGGDVGHLFIIGARFHHETKVRAKVLTHR